MPRHRNSLPSIDGIPFITDGGIETTLIFHYGIDLPLFAAFPLLDSDEGIANLRRYFQSYVDLAVQRRLGLVLESPTWRANSSWGAQLQCSTAQLAAVNRRAIDLMVEFRAQLDAQALASMISGNIGPRGDGYVPSALMSAQAAADYHRAQIETFAASEADLVTAVTLNYVEEALGIAIAARELRMPAVLSFTVETDGRLPTGDTLQRAIEETDEGSNGYPSYYMINCAHPTHLLEGIGAAGAWRKRVRGVRANASALSHAELNEARELDDGDPGDFGLLHLRLKEHWPEICVVGGCCGTDQRHVAAASAILARQSLPSPTERHPSLAYEEDAVLGSYIYSPQIESWTNRRVKSDGEKFLLMGRGRQPSHEQLTLWRNLESQLERITAMAIAAVKPPPLRADLFDSRTLKLREIRLEPDGTVSVFLDCPAVEDATPVGPMVTFRGWEVAAARWVP
jgi:S-methylmethionine-dependent homocysteine/selenocysteine methylase